MTHKHIAFVFLIGAVTLAGCAGEEQQADEEVLVKTVNVETEIIQPKTFERYLTLVGTVESENDVRISAEVSGRIERYYVSKGERITKGTPILKIDDSKLQREQARLQAQTDQAREQYQRLKRVFEQDSIGAEIDVINAKATYEERKSALESVEVDLRNTTVRAPFAASLDGKLLEEGEMASPGTPLVRLIGSENLTISAGVPARYSNVVSKGDRVKLWFDGQEADSLDGNIVYVANSIDPQNRTFKIEVGLPQKAQEYKVDMVANLRLNTLSEDSVIVVSEEFVYKQNDTFIAYLKAENENGDFVAEKRVVRLGPSYQSDVIIREGLQAGDELITTGSAFLNEGMKLNVIESGDEPLARKN